MWHFPFPKMAVNFCYAVCLFFYNSLCVWFLYYNLVCYLFSDVFLVFQSQKTKLFFYYCSNLVGNLDFKNAIWSWGHIRRTICNKILFLNLEKMPQKRMECCRLLFDYLAWIEHQFLSDIRDSKKVREYVRDDERCRRSKEVNTPELIGLRVRVRVTMLRF